MSDRLVVVKPKGTLDDTSVAESVVGEDWLKRWPDDFDLVLYVDGLDADGNEIPPAAPAEQPATATTASAGKAAPTDQPAQPGSRF